jgi:phosphoribosylformimino-5-aminoimidazole carboxamide ribotide isomerase
LIVLDLARVGLGGGTGTEALSARLAEAYPDVEVFAGGGVRGSEDLHRLRACGAAGVLVASALHDRRLQPGDLMG